MDALQAFVGHILFAQIQHILTIAPAKVDTLAQRALIVVCCPKKFEMCLKDPNILFFNYF